MTEAELMLSIQMLEEGAPPDIRARRAEMLRAHIKAVTEAMNEARRQRDGYYRYVERLLKQVTAPNATSRATRERAMEDVEHSFRMWLREASGGALSYQLAETSLEAIITSARVEGYAQAREQAASRYDRMAAHLRDDAACTRDEKLRQERLTLAERWESEARTIRAMTQEKP